MIGWAGSPGSWRSGRKEEGPEEGRQNSLEVTMLAQSLSVHWKLPVRHSHSKATSSVHIICFAQVFDTHSFKFFISSLNLHWKLQLLRYHGLRENNYWFTGVHSFELCNARGGVLNILVVLSIGSSTRYGRISQQVHIVPLFFCLFFTCLQGARSSTGQTWIHWLSSKPSQKYFSTKTLFNSLYLPSASYWVSKTPASLSESSMVGFLSWFYLLLDGIYLDCPEFSPGPHGPHFLFLSHDSIFPFYFYFWIGWVISQDIITHHLLIFLFIFLLIFLFTCLSS